MGSGNGQFSIPAGITVAGDRVYVTDDAHSRVQGFTRDGTYITQWGSTGDALNKPIGIAVRPVGHVLVVDHGNSRVVVYAPDGTFLTAFGSGGDGPG